MVELAFMCLLSHLPPYTSCRVTLETLISIFSSEAQFKVIRSNHLHRNRIHEYCSRSVIKDLGCGQR